MKIINTFEKDIKDYILSKINKKYLKEDLQIDASQEDIDVFFNSNDIFELMVDYMNFRKRLILGVDRDVLYSKEILSNRYYPKYRSQISKIEKIFKKGQSLRPYLSTKINEIQFQDKLLNSWGFHHLHFIEKFNLTEKHIRRSNEILFIMVFGDTVLFIDIFKHNDWVNPSCFEVLVKNWPFIMSHYELKGIKADENITIENLKEARKSNMLIPISMNGKVYMPPDGGTMSSGHSFMDVKNSMYIKLQLGTLIKELENNEEFLDNLKGLLKKDITEITLGLLFNEEKQEIIFYCEEAKARLNFGEDEVNLNQYFKELLFINPSSNTHHPSHLE